MLNRVTITGADDKTNIDWMLDVSRRFPFVEWGILVSATQEGSYRFPSRAWIDKLMANHLAPSLQLSTHLCGRWVRQLLCGELKWADVPSIAMRSQRIQINTHAETLNSRKQMIDNLRERDCQYIFQWDGVNDHFAYTAKCYDINTAILFDTSGGAGVLPERWPGFNQSFPCGYAGGLGPDNVLDQILEIEKRCPVGFWIDMERRVRTEDDSMLDEAKVVSVLEKCEAFIPRWVTP